LFLQGVSGVCGGWRAALGEETLDAASAQVATLTVTDHSISVTMKP